MKCDKAVIRREHYVMEEQQRQKIYQYSDEGRVISEVNLVKAFLNNIRWEKQQRGSHTQSHGAVKEIYIIWHKESLVQW